MQALDADAVIELLGLRPLVPEGGHFGQTWLDDQSSAIYYLLRRGECSLLHRLPGPEIYHHYAGAPLGMLLLHPDGSTEQPVLGDDLTAGQLPQVRVAGGVWQGSTSMGSWSLVGTTMAPPYRQQDFELGVTEELIARYPQVEDRIRQLGP